jgi:hypothetical protein
VEIKRFNKADKEFRDYILQDPNSLFYSEPRYVDLISAHLNAREFWLAAFERERLVGLLPLVIAEGPLGVVLNSMPFFGSIGGVIQAAPNQAAKSRLIEAFYEYAVELSALSATIVTNPLDSDMELYKRFAQASFVDQRIGQITHLPSLEQPEGLIRILDAPRPRNIRRAQKLGVTVIKSHEDSLDFLYQTHRQNMDAIGGLAKTLEFFQAIPKYLHTDDWAIFEATLDGRVIAALLVFYFNETVEYFTPVIVEEYRSTQALVFAIYTAMQDAIELGYRKWNWGGTWLSQKGVYEFKKRWSTTDYQYYYFTKLFTDKVFQFQPDFLVASYPGFFVLPFSELKSPDRVDW